MNGLETVIVRQASCAAALPDPARGAARIRSDSDERMMAKRPLVQLNEYVFHLCDALLS